MLGFLKRHEEEIPAIVAVEHEMDPALKKVETRRLHVVESIPQEIKIEDKVEKKPSHSEVTEYKIPQAVLDYLNAIIDNPGPGRNGISVSALKFDIEDDESLYTVISKIEKARKLKVLTAEEVKDIFEELGIRENIENTVEDIKVGEYVNWTLNNHEFEWDKPRRVRMVDMENGVAFVEGSNAPYLLENLKKAPVVVESQPVSKDNPLVSVEETPESPLEVSDAEFKIIDETKNEEEVVNPISEETFVGPMPEETFVGPLPENTTTEPAPEIVPTQTPEQIAEQEALDFKNAQEAYAKHLAEHKHKTREKKNILYRLLDDLGIESDKHKKLAEPDKTPEHIEAENAYLIASQKKAEKFFGQDEIRSYEKEGSLYNLKEGQEFKFNTKLFEEVKKDFDKLQELIKAGTPEKQETRTDKCLSWLNKKIPVPVRVATIASVIGVGVGMFSGMGVFGAAAYGGWRATKGLAGLGVSKGAGMYMDKRYAGKNAESKEEIFSKFAENITAENYLEKQKELEGKMSKQQEKEKQQILKKAGVMAVSGGLSTALLGGVWKPTLSQAVENPSGVSKAGISADANKLGATAGKIGSLPESSPVKVELSSKGYIQTLDDMKKQLTDKYAGKEMPKGVKEFIEKPSTKLAQDYGFYDAKKGLSGMGLKGEHLVVDSKGNLSLEHLDGKKVDAIDTTEHKFKGKMFGMEDENSVSAKEKYIEQPPSNFDVETGQLGDTATPTEIVPENDLGVTEPDSEILKPLEDISTMPKPEGLTELSKGFDMTFDNKKFHVDVTEIAGQKQILVDGVKIAESTPNSNFGGVKITQLLDIYQDGKKFAPLREAFNKAEIGFESDFIRDIKVTPNGGVIIGQSFESGKLNVVHGIGENRNAISVFLNGKEIGKGIITEKGPQVKIFENLKGGIFFADTVYERAFKVAQKTMKTIRLVK